MAVINAPSSIGAALTARRMLTALVLIGIAAAVGVGFYYRTSYPGGNSGSPVVDALGEQIHRGMNGVQSVADMLLGRSPGERADGALANLKHKRRIAPHERALPKIRKSVPLSPLAAIVGPSELPLPPVAAAPVPGTPLFNVVTTPPPAAESPPPTSFPGMPSPPPGGGLIIPPVITQVVPPSPPPPPPVPEPASWMMMLVGFAFIGRLCRPVPRPAPVIT